MIFARLKILNLLPILSLSLVFSLSITSEVFAADERGMIAFSDPSAVNEMDQEWILKRINYDPENKDAALVIVLNQQFYEFMLPFVKHGVLADGINLMEKPMKPEILASRLRELLDEKTA